MNRKPYAFWYDNKLILEKTYEYEFVKKTYANGKVLLGKEYFNELPRITEDIKDKYKIFETSNDNFILAIDPGNKESAYVIIHKETHFPLEFGKIRNDELCNKLYLYLCIFPNIFSKLVIEMVASYGMPVGKTVFDTCLAIGQFMNEYSDNVLITRQNVKKTLCNGNIVKVNDSVIRQRLMDLYGEVGTKNNRGWFYGFSADIWSAYAVGIAYLNGAEIYEI